jgi:hypothetical protein
VLVVAVMEVPLAVIMLVMPGLLIQAAVAELGIAILPMYLGAQAAQAL